MSLLSFKNLKLSDETGKTLIYIKNLSISKGDVISTEVKDVSNIFLELCSGNIKKPDSGEISINSKGALIKNYDSFSSFRPMELLDLTSRLSGKHFIKKEIQNFIKDFGIENKKLGKLDSYSKRIIFVLNSLICRNDVICLKEPFTDDADSNKKILSLLNKLIPECAIIIETQKHIPGNIFNRLLIFNEDNHLVKEKDLNKNTKGIEEKENAR